MIAPGIERFEYFRKLTRVAQGKNLRTACAKCRNFCDTYFAESPEWDAARK